MKGDFSRSTFDKSKHYSKVKIQQGRVQVDADWNEQVDIQSYHNIASLSDIIGQSGTSNKDAFKIQANGSTYSIGKGRYYVGGLVAENDESILDGIKWQQEHHLPPSEGIVPVQNSVRGMISPKDDGFYIAFLEVWEHHLTSLEEPEIKEPALGGPDTSTRVKTIWQVKLLFAGTTPPSISDDQNNLSTLFSSVAGWAELTDTNVGKLSARAKPVERKKDDLCAIPLSAGYSGLENQLYRVEIHNAAEPGKEATFKFAKNNATTAARITKISGDKISVSTPGKDASLGFADGKIGEIIDDRHEMWGLPGVLGSLTIDSADTSILTFKPDDGLTIQEADFPSGHNPKIRMWERKETVKIPPDNEGFIPLEHGVEIKFDAAVPYRSGDYWLIPARSFMLNKSSLTEESTLGDILWPKDNENPQLVSSARVSHKLWPLALLHFQAGNFVNVEADYRRIFPPLQDLVSFQYVGGDGQAAGPGQMLAAPLSVGVSLGDKPLSGVTVVFRVTTGNGLLFVQNDPNAAGGGQQILRQVTDAMGLAQCNFKLDDQSSNQVVEAFMLDVFGKRVHLPILFSGSILLNSQTAGLNARSGLVSLDIPAQSHKIIGPFIHGANELPNNTVPLATVPPAIILGQRNEDEDNNTTNPTEEKILHIQDLTDIILLNSRFGMTQPALPIPNEISPLANQIGLDQILSSDGENVPVLFKPIMIDHRQFYILAINYNKKSTQILWTPWSQIERGVKMRQMAIGKNADGRLEIFAITEGAGDVVHIAEVPPNGGWASAWSPFPLRGLETMQIHVARNQDGRLEVFTIDANGLIHHIWQTSPNSDAWSAWDPFSDFKVKQMTVGQNQDGRLHVFAIREDDAQEVWHRAQVQPSSVWHPWSSLPSTQIKLKAKKIFVASNQDGRLEVFVIGSPIKTEITQDPVRAGFEFENPIGVSRSRQLTPSSLRPAAGGGSGVVIATNTTVPRADIGVPATIPGNATERDIIINPGIRPNVNLSARPSLGIRPKSNLSARPSVAGEPMGSAPFAIDFASVTPADSPLSVANPRFSSTVEGSLIPPRPIIFEIQTDDDAIWHRWQNEPNNKDNWSEWEILSGLKANELAVARNQDGRLEVFAIPPRSTESDISHLYHRFQLTPNARSSFNWSGWTSLGANPDQMAITMDDDGRLEVFVLARRSRLILSSGITVDSQIVLDVLEREGIKTPESVDRRRVNEIFTNNAIVSRWEPENVLTNRDAHKIEGLLKMKVIPDFRNQSSVYRISQIDPSSNSWTGWDSLGGGNTSKLAVSNNAINQMVVFAITTSMDLFTLTQIPNDLHVRIRWWAIPTSSTSA